ncbi:3-keto-L-gulonate kinase [Chania multitudinisentens RB-25]|uniref:3-keto-L-gulonate kinase n=1 Tax=Chania multitudinisentens RB-25 TaxID=1441930 RepID=W0LHH6_9GAMM|nr:FGGY-family carbohydrate kinase [Chania multitudinisentens]AHG21405.1 3-keto-L-gulonate kinase [Chania multitudinisentens RB-25]
MGYFLGVDIGGTVIKAGLYRANGDEVAVAECDGEALAVQPGFSEREMEALWQDLCSTIRQVLSLASVAGEQVRGISFSSHGKGLYAIDKQGKPVRNGIVSSDTRASAMVTDLQRQGVEEMVYPRSLQPIWSSHPAVLLRWLKQHEPAQYAAIDYVLMAHDYLRFRLTGEVAAEITNISGSNLFNQQNGGYDPQLMAVFGIDEVADKTAPLLGSAELAGRVTATAAAQCGLPAGTAVYGGLFDVVGAALCSGVVDDRTLSAVAGTWSIATCVTESVLPSTHPFAWGRYCMADRYFVHEGSPTSAANLAWFLRQFCNNDHQRYAQFNRWVAERSERPSDIVFLPYLYGSNLNSNLPGALIGLSGHHEMADIVHAIYQGILFSHLIHQDRMVALNPRVERIRMTGGPTQSAVWMQMFANAGNLPLEVVDIQQSGCRAAAICAAVGAGEYANFTEAVQVIQPELHTYFPDAAANRRLRDRFTGYLEIAQALSEVNNASH